MDIQVEFYWPENKSREDIIRERIWKYWHRHPGLTVEEKLASIFRNLSYKDFCIITFGTNEWNYLQYSPNKIGLILDFPWSVSLGRRYRQRDLIQLYLESRGFKRKNNWLLDEEYDASRHFYDYILGESSPALIVSYGKKGEEEAAHQAIEIAGSVFRVREDEEINVKFGSWR